MPIHQAEKLLMESCVKNPIVFTSVRGGLTSQFFDGTVSFFLKHCQRHNGPKALIRESSHPRIASVKSQQD